MSHSAVLLANPERITPYSGPGCEPQGKGDCIAPVCKTKGYACDNDHEQCFGYYEQRVREDMSVNTKDGENAVNAEETLG